ncbi:MAG: hypothetical protein CM1200mP10_18560 [Candidatus Neomarinimicrobiota bacterium]|nr:MAG: hypothetical protein CM1200mP10_18560 [Candidatus Neomarinimicrobiota bacterium]
MMKLWLLQNFPFLVSGFWLIRLAGQFIWGPKKIIALILVEISKKINDYTKIIYIANPDNPMGTYITKEEFDEFYAHVPSVFWLFLMKLILNLQRI